MTDTLAESTAAAYDDYRAELLADAPDDIDGWDVPEGARQAPDDEIAAADREWAETQARRLRAVKRRLAEYTAILNAELGHHEKEMNRLVERHRALTGDLERRQDYLTDSLAEFILTTRRRTNDRVKSIPLLYGTLSTTQGQRKWDVDPGAAIEWARVNAPDLVAQPPATFKLADAKRVMDALDDGTVVVKATGLVVDGIKAMPADTYAKVAVEGDAS